MKGLSGHRTRCRGKLVAQRTWSQPIHPTCRSAQMGRIREVRRMSRIGPGGSPETKFERSIEPCPKEIGSKRDAGFRNEQVSEPPCGESNMMGHRLERELLSQSCANKGGG